MNSKVLQVVPAMCFCVGIVSAMCFMNVSLLDRLTIPRLCSGAIFLLLTLILLWKNLRGTSFKLSDILFFAYFLWSCVTCFLSRIPTEGYSDLVILIILYGFFRLSSYFVKQSSHYIVFLIAVVNIAAVVSIMAICIDLCHISMPYSTESLFQLKGLHGHKNETASLLAMIVPFNLYYIIYSQRLRIVPSIVVVLCVVMIMFLQSRTAIMVLFIGIVGILFFSRNLLKNKRLLVGLAAVFVLSGSLWLGLQKSFFGEIFPRHDVQETNPYLEGFYYKSTENPVVMTSSAYERLGLWNNTLNMIAENPITGVGAGNWKLNYAKYGLEDIIRADFQDTVFTSPHNDYLLIASEKGIIGLLLYLSFVLFVVVRYLLKEQEKKWFQNAAVVVVVVMFATAFLDFPHQNVAHCCLLFVCLGLLRDNEKTLFAPVPFRVISSCLLLGIIIVTFQMINSQTIATKIYNEKKTYPEKLESYYDRINHSVCVTTSMGIPPEWYVGNAFAVKNDKLKMLSYFSKAYEIAPYNKYVLNDFASAQYNNGNIEKAEQLYRQSLTISPRFDMARLNYSILLIDKHRYKDAWWQLQQIVDTTNSQYRILREYAKGKIK